MLDTQIEAASLDHFAERQSALLKLFPEARAEGGISIDFEQLRAALGDFSEQQRERYNFTWAGKSTCQRALAATTTATLLPSLERSINFEATDNLIIEGDNLQVLKVIQKAYVGRIKMIYIDPPYNTGNDFIYPDDYSETLQTYLRYTGQVDIAGRRFGTNVDTDGRFHSKWISMMYPRLELARNLLRDDGVIMVSIDDGEVHNLRLIMNAVFGEENFCGTIIWEKKRKPSFLDASMAVRTEYIVCYARDRSRSPAFTSGSVEHGKMFPFNNAGNPLGVLRFPAGSVQFGMHDGIVEPQDMSEGNIKTRLLDPVEIRDGKNVGEFRLEGEWRYSQNKLDEFIAAGDEIVIRRMPFRPNYVNRSDKAKKMANLLSVKGTGTPTYEDATEEIRKLFGEDIIPYPKPTGLIERLIDAVTGESDVILDFFAGSGTTGHAVLNLNAAQGTNRKFILVQLPEPTDREDYRTIADICRERVKRAINTIDATSEAQLRLGEAGNERRGFRAFTLAQSNVTEWDSEIDHDADVLAAQLKLRVDHLRSDRGDLDIVYEALLKSGYPLTSKVAEQAIEGKCVYSIADGAFIICLDRELTLGLLRAIAACKPERVLLLDEGFAGNDQLKANAVQTFTAKNIVLRTL